MVNAGSLNSFLLENFLFLFNLTCIQKALLNFGIGGALNSRLPWLHMDLALNSSMSLLYSL